MPIPTLNMETLIKPSPTSPHMRPAIIIIIMVLCLFLGYQSYPQYWKANWVYIQLYKIT